MSQPTTLSGRKPSDTFPALLKLTRASDSTADASVPGITSSLAYITDGLGNNSALQLSDSAVALSGVLWPSAAPSTGMVLRATSTSASSWHALTSDDLTEGTNEFYTDAKVRAAVSASGSLSYNSTTGVFSYTAPTTTAWSTVTGTPTTLSGYGITDGTSNARSAISVTGSLGYNSTTGVLSYTTPGSDGISEGTTHLFYTDTRARGAVSATGSLSYDSSTGVFSYTAPTTYAWSAVTGTPTTIAGYGITDVGSTAKSAISVSGSLAYNSTTGVISYSTPTSDGISEGTTHLFYTDAKARGAISVSGDLAYSSSTGVISYSTPATRAWSTITSTPTTLAGYGITDATSSALAAISVTGSLSYNSTTGVISYTTPTTDGITEGTTNHYYLDSRARGAVSASGDLSYSASTGVFSYTTPATRAWSTITGTPTTVAGYGITDVGTVAKGAISVSGSLVYNSSTGVISYTTPATYAWSAITSTPTTLSGYGITDATSNARGAISVSGSLSYNSATGVISYTTPSTTAWSAITGTPTTISGYGLTDAAPLASPALTGTPTAPTATAGTNTTQLATTAFVTSAVSAGTSSSAAKLSTARTISTTGDATWTVTFDGSANVTAATTLATVNASPVSSSFSKVTTNGKGLVTSTTPVVVGDITGLLSYTGDVSTSGTTATLATVNSSPVTASFSKMTTNGKGLVTATTPVVASDITALVDSIYLNVSGDTMTGVLNLGGFTATGSGAPTNGTDLTTKNYVDAAIAGLSWKIAVKAATTANITLSGAQTIDGIALVAGDRVLVKNQTDQTTNGIYVVASGAWIRATDSTTATQLDGEAVYVQQGSTQKDTGWTETATVTTVGTDNLVYSQFSGSGTYVAGVGLSLTGNTFANTGVLSISGSTNLTASASTGAITLSLPTTLTGLTSVSSTGFTGALTGNASTATALANARTISITGDLTYTSPSFDGSGNVTAAGTLATVNASPVTASFSKVTTNGKGLVTATTPVVVGDITGLLSYTGDVTTSGTTATLATVNSNTGAFGSSTAIPVVTVNAKGLVTAVSTSAVVAPAGTLTGTTLASNVVTSSLTSVGTLTSLSVTGAVTVAGVGAVYGATLTTSTTAAGQAVDSLAIATYRSVKYVVSITSGSAYQYTEVTMIQDGTNVYITENNTVNTGATLASFTADISAGNMRLLTTPVNAVTKYNVVATAIAV